MIFRNVYHGACRSSALAPRSLRECLSEFRSLVNEQVSCKSVYEGWPPRSRITVRDSMNPLGRNVFVINRRLENGLDFEPTLVFCCGSKPMLMMSRSEFSSFVSHLPVIKSNMESFFKLL